MEGGDTRLQLPLIFRILLFMKRVSTHCGPSFRDSLFLDILRPVQTHYTRTIQHSTLYDRHCIALLGNQTYYTRTIQPLYKYDETENCGLRLPMVPRPFCFSPSAILNSSLCVISSTSTAHARMQYNHSTSRVVRSNELDFVEYRFSDHETKEKSSGCRVEV